MARKKHAAALFEVIHSNHNAPKAGGFPTPKWWFKSRSKAQAPAIESSHAPEVSPTDPTAAYKDSASGSNVERAGLRLDRDRSEVTMRMRFSTMVIGSFAVLVALGMAYVVGRHVSGGPDAANADPVDDVSNIAPAPAPKPAPTPPIDSARNGRRLVDINKNGTNVVGPSGRKGETPVKPHDLVKSDVPVAETIGPRVAGKNYIFVASCPPEKLDAARQACEVLRKAGVPCSLEKVPPIYFSREGWMAVISQRGFRGMSDDDCKRAMKIVEDVRKSNSRVFDALKNPDSPTLFQWK